MLLIRVNSLKTTKPSTLVTKRNFAQANRQSESVEKEWWKENKALQENRLKDQPNVVFIEGISDSSYFDQKALVALAKVIC